MVLDSELVFGEVDLPRDAAALRKVSEELRQIRHNKLEYEITRDPQKFDDFYHNMYVPFATGRFGACADVSHYQELKTQFEDSDLLLVKYNNQAVAGSLLLHGKTPCLWDLGIRDGDRALSNAARRGPLSLRLAVPGNTGTHQCGPRLVGRFSATAATVQAEVVATNRPRPLSGFTLKILAATPAAIAFLRENPFICTHHGSFCAAVFVEGDEAGFPTLRRLEKDFLHDGLARLLIRLRPGSPLCPTHSEALLGRREQR